MLKNLAEYENLSYQFQLSEDIIKQYAFPEQGAPFLYINLAFLQKKPVGIAVYYYTFSTFKASPILYIEDLFVLPDYRKQRIGLKLFQQLIKTAKISSCKAMDWSVLEWNTKAQAFYTKQGAFRRKDWILYRLENFPQ